MFQAGSNLISKMPGIEVLPVLAMSNFSHVLDHAEHGLRIFAEKM
jgi:hypothetical protein